MRMTLFSGFVAQSILRWTSLMRSSVDIDSSASEDILFSYDTKKMNDFRDAKRWSYKKMRKERRRREKEKDKKKKNDDDDFMKSKT